MSLESKTAATLAVTPTEALVDERLDVTVEGLTPGTEATLVVTWDGASRYRGEATFVADDDGVVDPAEQSPVRGDYDGVRPMGLVQFAREIDNSDDDGDDIEDSVDDDDGDDIDDGHRLHLTLVVDGDTQDETTVVRRQLAADVTQIAVEDHDEELVGDLFVPPGDGPHPGVLLLGGSGGGIPSGVRAKVLASRGYAVLALAYFQPSDIGADTGDEDRSLDRLPETMVEVPLSYFDHAVAWLADHEAVADVGVVGGSRGSEPAVLTAARNDAVSSVVVSAPLAYAFCTFEREAFGDPAWVDDDEPVPYLTNEFRFGSIGMFVRIFWLAFTGGDISYARSFRRAVENASASDREAAALPVEEADAPFFFVSGGDDELGPSEYMGRTLVDRLDEHEYDHEYSHHSYPAAGHVVSVPYTPVRGREAGDPMVGRMGIALGGCPTGYAEADVDSWERMLAFLDRTLV